MTLTDRVALVTGASSGIGAATARRLAADGYAVGLLARREERLETVAEEADGETLVLPADVTDPEAVRSAVGELRETYGGLDVLVNNAGVARGGPVAETELSALRESVRVNLDGAMTVTHAALPAIRESEAGDVCFVSSLAARYPQAGGSSYTASKFGVNGFARSLRKELSDEQVRVNILMPGSVVTELNDWSHWDGRAMEPSDIADTVAFVLSRPPHVEITELSVDTTDKF